MEDTVKIIAHIRTDFPEKFGIPRQSGLCSGLSVIEFEEAYRVDAALRGIEGFSHLWLIWKFSESCREDWSPTVRPPRLGGNRRMGVFATRSPFRPNPIGLSSVELVGVIKTERGTVLQVRGADLMDGTPIYDIKPYLAFTDSHPDARGGFAQEHLSDGLRVEMDSRFRERIPADKLPPLLELLEQDPRPAYIEDPTREFGFGYADYEIRFRVEGDVLYVTDVAPGDKTHRGEIGDLPLSGHKKRFDGTPQA